MAERIKLSDFEEKVLNSSVPVLVDFYSDSCVPCKRLAPVVGTVEDERAESLSVYKVNINFDADAASEYEVTAAIQRRLRCNPERLSLGLRKQL